MIFNKLWNSKQYATVADNWFFKFLFNEIMITDLMFDYNNIQLDITIVLQNFNYLF